MNARPLITLTTDFGLGSPYVAQMKGVILSLCREVDLLDISHAVGPQNVREGAVVLADATPRFPPATIHVAVVDPGVGTNRRVIYAQIDDSHYLAPDNGLLSLLAQHRRLVQVIELANQEYWLPETSYTFHGRDILAPVAAHLALGVDPVQFGPQREGLIKLHWPQVTRSVTGAEGEVLYVDSFGNIITNIARDDVARLGDGARLVVHVAERTIHGLVPTYAAAMPGELAALFDSQSRLEVALVGGNAARGLNARAGDPVSIASNL